MILLGLFRFLIVRSLFWYHFFCFVWFRYGYVRLPYVYTASEIQEMKFWRLNVKESLKIVDPIKRARNQTSRMINMQLSKLSSITRQASMEFPALKKLHPFERVRKCYCVCVCVCVCVCLFLFFHVCSNANFLLSILGSCRSYYWERFIREKCPGAPKYLRIAS